MRLLALATMALPAVAALRLPLEKRQMYDGAIAQYEAESLPTSAESPCSDEDIDATTQPSLSTAEGIVTSVISVGVITSTSTSASTPISTSDVTVDNCDPTASDCTVRSTAFLTSVVVIATTLPQVSLTTSDLDEPTGTATSSVTAPLQGSSSEAAAVSTSLVSIAGTSSVLPVISSLEATDSLSETSSSSTSPALVETTLETVTSLAVTATDTLQSSSLASTGSADSPLTELIQTPPSTSELTVETTTSPEALSEVQTVSGTGSILSVTFSSLSGSTASDASGIDSVDIIASGSSTPMPMPTTPADSTISDFSIPVEGDSQAVPGQTVTETATEFQIVYLSASDASSTTSDVPSRSDSVDSGPLASGPLTEGTQTISITNVAALGSSPIASSTIGSDQVASSTLISQTQEVGSDLTQTPSGLSTPSSLAIVSSPVTESSPTAPGTVTDGIANSDPVELSPETYLDFTGYTGPFSASTSAEVSLPSIKESSSTTQVAPTDELVEPVTINATGPAESLSVGGFLSVVTGLATPAEPTTSSISRTSDAVDTEAAYGPDFSLSDVRPTLLTPTVSESEGTADFVLENTETAATDISFGLETTTTGAAVMTPDTTRMFTLESGISAVTADALAATNLSSFVVSIIVDSSTTIVLAPSATLVSQSQNFSGISTAFVIPGYAYGTVPTMSAGTGTAWPITNMSRNGTAGPTGTITAPGGGNVTGLIVPPVPAMFANSDAAAGYVVSILAVAAAVVGVFL